MHERALADRDCQPGRNHVRGTPTRSGEAGKATSVLGSALTAYSVQAATTTS